jgi:hypothetical protein
MRSGHQRDAIPRPGVGPGEARIPAGGMDSTSADPFRSRTAGRRCPWASRRCRSHDAAEEDVADSLQQPLVSNGAYRLDRIGGFGRRERLDAGHLGIVTVTLDGTRDVPALIAAEAAGRIRQFPATGSGRRRSSRSTRGRL